LFKEKLNIILDSSIVLLSVEKRFDLFDEIGRVLNRSYNCIVLTQVFDEIKHLAEQGNVRERRLGRLALELIRRCKFVEYEFPGDADQAIIDYARKNKVVVATNDLQLRRCLRRVGVPVIYVRGFDHLDIDGDIYW